MQPPIEGNTQDLAAAVHAELQAAQSADLLARRHRCQAGALLAQAKAATPDTREWGQLIHRAELDSRTVDLLMEMHAGAVPR